MKLKMTIIIIIFISSLNLFSNKFIKTFGGTDTDIAEYVQQTNDGGYIVAGATLSFGVGDYDFWIIKTNENGIEEWNRTFGGINSDIANSIQETTDGGFIIVGETRSFGNGYSDYWMIKTDANGIEEWNRTFGGANEDIAKSVQETNDGGYIIAGHSYSYGLGFCDIWIVKTDVNGIEEWNRTYGTDLWDFTNSIVQTNDGGYIIGAYTALEDHSYPLLIKIESNGNIEWSKIIGNYGYGIVTTIQQTNDGGYIYSGYSVRADAGESDCFITKTDDLGNVMWRFAFANNVENISAYIQQTTDNGYIFVKSSYEEYHEQVDSWLIKYNEEGVIEWEKNFFLDGWDVFKCVKQTQDQGYIISGHTTSLGVGHYDVWLIKTDENGNTTNINNENIIQSSNKLSQNYPNPFNPTTTIQFSIAKDQYIKLSVYDIHGNEIDMIIEGGISAGQHSIEFDGSKLTSGQYFYKIESDEFSEIKKMILLK